MLALRDAPSPVGPLAPAISSYFALRFPTAPSLRADAVTGSRAADKSDELARPRSSHATLLDPYSRGGARTTARSNPPIAAPRRGQIRRQKWPRISPRD